MRIMSQASNRDADFSSQQHFQVFDDPQISLYYNLKHYDLKLRLKICAPPDVIAKAKTK